MKNKLLFIPVILTTLSLVGCNKEKSKPVEYKFDDPAEIIKLFYGRARIDYPYESADGEHWHDIDNKFTYEIRDRNGVILNGLNQVKTYEKVDAINPTTEDCINFYAYLAPETLRYQAKFTIYADGSLTYGIQRVISEDARYNFTFDANIAKLIIRDVKEEIEEAKVVEEEILSALTVESYVKVLENSEYYSSRRVIKGGNPVYMGGLDKSVTVMSALKTLEYTPVDSVEGQRKFGDGAVMTITRNNSDASQIPHVASIDQTYTIFNEEGTYIQLYFSLRDYYGRWITDNKYFAIDPVEGKKAVENILKLFPNY